MSSTERDPAPEPPPAAPVAIVGMACRLPGAPDLTSFWRSIAAARGPTAPLPPPPAGDAEAEGSALLTAVVQEALTDSGSPSAGQRRVLAVEAAPSLLDAIAVGVEGLPVTIPLAEGDEGSSMAAIARGIAALRAQEADLAVAAAVEPDGGHFASRPGALLSPSGEVRAFADDADGGLPGWGAGAIVLRRLEDALEAGDRIYAVLREVASSRGPLEAAVRGAHEVAGLLPPWVPLVEGHGSGVPGEDGAEIAALTGAFGESPWPDVALGSAKSVFGDPGRAGGMVGIIKAALSLHQRVLSPTANVARANPALGCGRILPNTTLRPWISPPATPRRAGVSARDAAGRWAYALLEEGPAGEDWASLTPWPAELLLFSGADRRALVARVEELSRTLDGPGGWEIGDLAFAACRSFDGKAAVRLAIVAAGADDLKAKVERTLDRLRTAVVDSFVDPQGIYLGSGVPEGRMALLFGGIAFPGLTIGSTTRFGELCLHFPEVRRQMDLADAESAGEAEPPYPLRHQFFPPALLDARARDVIEQELALTSRTALGMFVSYIASWDLLRSLGVVPDVLAGFSLGEWGALYAAGVLGLEDLAAFRRTAEGIEERPADQEGIWAMVGASAARIEPILRGFSDSVSVTVDISPENVLIGGSREEVQEVAARLTREGIWVQPIDLLLKNPPHTPMLNAWTDTIREVLAGLPIHEPTLPVVCGITGEPYPDDPETIRDLMAEIPLRHVRIQETIQRLYSDGVRTFVQTGMGGRLSTVIHSTLKLEPHLALSLDALNRGGLEQLLHFLGRLAALGAGFDPMRLFRNRRVRVPEARPPAVPEELAQAPRPGPPGPVPAALQQMAGTQGFAEVFATFQAFLQMQAEQDEADRRVLESFLRTQEAVLKALLPLAAAKAAGPPDASPRRPLLGHIVHLAPRRELRSRLLLDLKEHPFLADHTLLKIPPELRPAHECLPTLPMTFGIEIMAEAAAALLPDLAVLGLRDIQVTRWLWLKDTSRLQLEVSARAVAPGAVETEIWMEGVDRPVYSGVVELGEAPPPPEPLSVRNDRPTPHTGPELYSRDRLFHGPAFQVVEVLEGMSDEGISGVLGVRDPAELFAAPPSAPMIFDPVILDAVGQVCGYRSQVDGVTAYPVQVERALVFGPPLPAGSRVRTVARRGPEAGRLVIWDLDALRPDGSVWMRLEGWKTWKFMWREEVRAFFFDQRRMPIGTPWDAGIPGAVCVRLHHATLTDLDLERLVRSYLIGEEFERYKAEERLDSLLGMVAAKDAVRMWFQRERGLALHPLQVRLGWLASGAPCVSVPSEPALALSVAHTDEEALAVVACGPAGVGCDLLRLSHRLPSLATTALDEEERGALPEAGSSGEWLHRAVAAKEAAAKSFGQGYEALPRYRVHRAEPATGLLEVRCHGGSVLPVKTLVHDGTVLALAVRPPEGA